MLRLVAGLVLVSALVAGGGVLADRHLRDARRDDARRVAAAYDAGDCAGVSAAYRGATSGPVLPRRRPPVPRAAATAAAECRVVQGADALVTSGRPADA